MLSPRWLVGLILIYVVGLWASNWVDGNSILTVSDLNILDRTANITLTAGTNSDGVEIISASKDISTWKTVLNILTFNFSYFYDIDPITGTQTPNIWYMLIKIPMNAMMIIIGIFIVILIRQAFGIG